MFRINKNITMRKITTLIIFLLVGLIIFIGYMSVKEGVENQNNNESKVENQNNNESKTDTGALPEDYNSKEEFYLETVIDKNSLVITDTRSNLNGMEIIYKNTEKIEESDRFSIKVMPCSKTPLNPAPQLNRISDCFSVEGGTNDDVLIMFPNELFESYDQEINEEKIALRSLVKDAEDVPTPFWSVNRISMSGDVPFLSTSYFMGHGNAARYYFIGAY